MLIKEMEIPLSELLVLAISSPESGSVNFSYLHDFLRQLLSHLGLQDKLARVAQEVDYRNVDPSPYNQPNNQGSRAVLNRSSIFASASNNELLNGKAESIKDIKSEDKGISETTEAGSELTKNTDQQGSDSSGKNNEDVKSSNEGDAKGNDSAVKDIVPQQIRKPSIITPDEPVSGRRRSSLNQRRNTGRDSLTPGDVQAQIESGEGLTKAGDMWHVMNINRRVETSEASIEGLMSMFDTMKSGFDDVRGNLEEMNRKIKEFEASKLQEKKEKSKIGTDLKKYGNVEDKKEVKSEGIDGAILNEKFFEINEKIDSLATKAELKPFCNVDQVKAIVDKNLIALNEPGQKVPIMAGSEDKESVNALRVEMKDQYQKLSDKVNTIIDNGTQVKQVPTNVPTNEKIEGLQDLQVEMHGEYQKLSDEMSKVKERINSLEVKGSSPIQKDEAHKGPVVDPSMEYVKKNVDSLNKNVTDIGSECGSLRKNISSLEEANQSFQKDLSNLSNRSDTFSEAQRNMAISVSKLERDLEAAIDTIQSTQGGSLKKKSSNDTDTDNALKKMRATVYDIQEKQATYQNEIDSLSVSQRKQDQELNDINSLVETLEKTKVDKEFVRKQVETKVDKKEIGDVITRDQFDDCMSGIDRNIQNLIQDMQGNETKNMKALSIMQEHLEDKMNREDAAEIRGYIDSRFKSFKPKIPQVKPSEDYAAGSRKRVMPDCNCISCDRPVDVPFNDPCPTLPYYHALPGMKSIRPVTTFELQTIRQHIQHSWPQGNKDRFLLSEARGKLQKELLQLCGANELNELAIQTPNRPCGGVHTLGQHRKNPGKPPMFYREDYSQFQPEERQRNETNVVGKDGHIYKGRKQVQQDNELPDIHQSVNKTRSAEALPRSGSKTKVVVNSPTPNDIVTVLPTIETS